MRIVIRPRALDLDADTHDYAIRHAHVALGRFAARLDEIVLRVEDVNGPRGGEDKVCRLTATVRHGRPVVIEQRATTVKASVDGACQRAANAVARELARTAAGGAP